MREQIFSGTVEDKEDPLIILNESEETEDDEDEDEDGEGGKSVLVLWKTKAFISEYLSGTR